MLFLSSSEKEQWALWRAEIGSKKLMPETFSYGGRSNLRSVFDFYVGTVLLAEGRSDAGWKWIKHGTFIEEDGLFLNAFLAGFLERHEGKFIMPETVFADPRPYVHFTTVPIMRNSRLNFLKQCSHSMPEMKRPFRMMDIGCGDGGLTAALIERLREAGRIGDIGEILLVDPSEKMLEMAQRTLADAVPDAPARTLLGRFEKVSHRIEGSYDLAVCSLSYHHMPYQTKIEH